MCSFFEQFYFIMDTLVDLQGEISEGQIENLERNYNHKENHKVRRQAVTLETYHWDLVLAPGDFPTGKQTKRIQFA